MSRIRLERTPEPPFWAVVFPTRIGGDDAGYVERVSRMLAMAPLHEGFLGSERVCETNGEDTVVAYWESLEAIGRWKIGFEKRLALHPCRTKWSSPLPMRVANIQTAAQWGRKPSQGDSRRAA